MQPKFFKFEILFLSIFNFYHYSRFYSIWELISIFLVWFYFLYFLFSIRLHWRLFLSCFLSFYQDEYRISMNYNCLKRKAKLIFVGPYSCLSWLIPLQLFIFLVFIELESNRIELLSWFLNRIIILMLFPFVLPLILSRRDVFFFDFC